MADETSSQEQSSQLGEPVSDPIRENPIDPADRAIREHLIARSYTDARKRIMQPFDESVWPATDAIDERLDRDTR